MTEDMMNPKICPSALDEDGNNAFADDEGHGGHKWDDTTNPITCSECGTEKEESNS